MLMRGSYIECFQNHLPTFKKLHIRIILFVQILISLISALLLLTGKELGPSTSTSSRINQKIQEKTERGVCTYSGEHTHTGSVCVHMKCVYAYEKCVYMFKCAHKYVCIQENVSKQDMCRHIVCLQVFENMHRQTHKRSVYIERQKRIVYCTHTAGE